VETENLTIDAVSQLTNVSVATLRYWRHRNEGPRSFRLGRRVMYRRTDVNAWLEAQYEASAPKGAA